MWNTVELLCQQITQFFKMKYTYPGFNKNIILFFQVPGTPDMRAIKKNCKSIMWKSAEIITKDPLLKSGQPLFTWNLVHSVNKCDTGHNNGIKGAVMVTMGKYGLEQEVMLPKVPILWQPFSPSTLSYGTIPLSKRMIFKVPAS